MVSEGSAQYHLCGTPLAVLEHPLGGLHRGLVPVVAMWKVGAARVVCDVLVLQPMLEDTTHHLGSPISGDVFWNVPRSSEVSHDCDQVLAVKLARGAGHNGRSSQ